MYFSAALAFRLMTQVSRYGHMLKVTVTGTADPQGERDSARRAMLELRLRAEQQREALLAAAAASAAPAKTAAATAASASAAMRPDAEAARARLLKSLLRQLNIPGVPKDAAGEPKDLSPAQMEALLLPSFDTDPETMRDLAAQRGTIVRDALLAKGLPSERLFLGAPRIAAGASAASGSAASAAPPPASAVGPRVLLGLTVD